MAIVGSGDGGEHIADEVGRRVKIRCARRVCWHSGHWSAAGVEANKPPGPSAMKLVTLQPVEGAQKKVDIKVGKTIIGRGPLLEVRFRLSYEVVQDTCCLVVEVERWGCRRALRVVPVVCLYLSFTRLQCHPNRHPG